MKPTEFFRVLRNKIDAFKVLTGEYPGLCIISYDILQDPEMKELSKTNKIVYKVGKNDDEYYKFPMVDKGSNPMEDIVFYVMDIRGYFTSLKQIIEVY